ncbi:MAG TPA: hypothetical protein VK864_16010 [Longimicrobiales bacterium]|nr:hypothetical protein [Longimicrobiales bacterium]
MKATRIARPALPGPLLLFIALLAMAGLAGSPVAAQTPFPAFMPMADTPSGIVVDKIGNVFVSVRAGGRGIIWKYTPDGIGSFLADLGAAVIYGC